MNIRKLKIFPGLNLVSRKMIFLPLVEKKSQQECIPVGCGPPTRNCIGGSP